MGITTARRGTAGAVALALLTTVLSCSGDPAGPADRNDIDAWLELLEVPGASIAVIRDFQVVSTEVYGVRNRSPWEEVTPETLFQAASLSKSVSGMTMTSLAQDGTIDLDRDVDDYLISWDVPDNSLQANAKVTIRRLLSHTAGTTVHGFRGYRYTEEIPTLVEILNGTPPANSAPIVVDLEPGRQFRYSGGGYQVMEQAVRDVTGKDYAELVREQVLTPLGMTSSTYEQPLPESMLPRAAAGYYASGVQVPGEHHIYPELAAAALWTTPADLARFLIEIQLSLRDESNRVLSRQNTEMLITEVRNDYALGLALRSEGGHQYFWHGGANDGFRSGMIAHPTSGDGLVVMTNSDNGDQLFEALLEVIGEREGWPGY